MAHAWRPALVAGAFLLGGCERLVSDSASRISFALREGARRLAGSPDSTLNVRISARTWPAGCAVDYRVDFVPDSSAVPGLAVRCLPDGPVYTSGSHLPIVHSDSALGMMVRATQPVRIMLKKDGNRVLIAGFSDED